MNHILSGLWSLHFLWCY